MSTATERARGRREAARGAAQDAAREKFRRLVTRTTAEAVAAMLRDDLDGLREALVERLVLVEETAATYRRPDLRVIPGGGESAGEFPPAEPGRLFPSRADLVAAGIAMPALRLVRDEPEVDSTTSTP